MRISCDRVLVVFLLARLGDGYFQLFVFNVDIAIYI